MPKRTLQAVPSKGKADCLDVEIGVLTMIKSMTGYGRANALIDGRDITVEMKSVNHRYFEFSAKVPRAYGFLEEKLKSYAQASISRGKIDAYVSIMTLEGTTSDVSINHELAAAYISALRELGTTEQLADDLTLSAISRFSDIFTVKKIVEDDDSIWQAVRQVADEATQKFVAMRTLEGEHMQEDLLSRLASIEDMVAVVEAESPKTVEEYRNKLYAKLSEVLSDNRFDDQRVLTEAAIFAERIAVAEETVRLHSHIKQFREILTYDEPVGRKLDFLVQEINREANTIGSKAQAAPIARIVVDIKSEIEKIREQIQNIE